MSNKIHLLEFNGSVRRNRAQEALLRDLDKKEEFMETIGRCREQRKLDSKRKHAALTIQKWYRSYRVRKALRNSFRRKFDEINNEEDVESQIACLSIFFDPGCDSSRLISLCSKILSLQNSVINLSSYHRRLFLRSIVQCLRSQAITCSVSYVALLRCMDLFTTAADSVWIVRQGFCTAIINLFCNSVCVNQNISLKERLIPHAESVLKYLFLPVCLPNVQRHEFIHPFLFALSQLHLEENVTKLIVCFLRKHMSTVIFIKDIILSLSRKEYLIMDDVERIRYAYFLSAFLSEVQMERHRLPLVITFAELLQPFKLSIFSFSPLVNAVNESDMLVTDGHSNYDPPPHCSNDSQWMSHHMHIITFLRQYLLPDLLSIKIVRAEEVEAICSIGYYLCCIDTTTTSESFFDLLGNKTGFLYSLWRLGLCPHTERSLATGINVSSAKKEQATIGQNEVLYTVLNTFFCELFVALQDSCTDIFIGSGRQNFIDTFSVNDAVLITQHLRNLALNLDRLVSCNHFSAPLRLRTSWFIWSGFLTILKRVMDMLYDIDIQFHYMSSDFWSNHTLWNFDLDLVRLVASHDRIVLPFSHFRNAFCPQKSMKGAVGNLQNIYILRNFPFLVPFSDRVKIFAAILRMQKDSNPLRIWGANFYSLTIRRATLYEDAFEQMKPMNMPDLRSQKIRVRMVNWAGLNESGIDGGGIFKEFITELIKISLNPTHGLFITTDKQRLYPNPLAITTFPDYEDHFYFVGRLIGKVILEELLIDVSFADFFLVQCFKSYDPCLLGIKYIKSYDRQIHANLMYLKNCSPEEVDSLELDFSIFIDNFGEQKNIDLKPDGSKIRVNSENRNEFISLYATYLLSTRMEPMISSFKRGIENVLEPHWLQMFSTGDIQVLIGGVDAEIDVDDLKSNTTIHNISSNDDRLYVENFWLIVRGLSSIEKKMLLKFITGCSRPPLMGFKELVPRMGIQLVHDTNALPMAATCLSLLKLPVYTDTDTLCSKLKMAISSNAGFEME